MAKPLVLSNGQLWSTQAAAITHFKMLLSRYADGDRVNNWADHVDLVALLDRYDLSSKDEPSKVGAGVRFFQRRRVVTETYASSSFWVCRLDGEVAEFSYLTALKGVPRGDARQFYLACQAAVQEDVDLTREALLATEAKSEAELTCAVSNTVVSQDTLMLQHVWPCFGQLVGMFRARMGWTHEIPQATTVASDSDRAGARFADTSVSESFRALHEEHARLTPVIRGMSAAVSKGARRPKLLPAQVVRVRLTPPAAAR